ncbi:MAG: hypothetical protein MZV63_34255 [Marinilabiliales bacterium]|nr:hypothetical protein [Marinilabiliales bacterium]
MFGALLAWAVAEGNPHGVFRRQAVARSGVLAQFGGVMLAFAFLGHVRLRRRDHSGPAERGGSRPACHRRMDLQLHRPRGRLHVLPDPADGPDLSLRPSTAFRCSGVKRRTISAEAPGPTGGMWRGRSSRRASWPACCSSSSSAFSAYADGCRPHQPVEARSCPCRSAPSCQSEVVRVRPTWARPWRSAWSWSSPS